MDDALVVYVSHGGEHFLDEAGALGFGVVVVGLLVEAVEEFAAFAYFLDQVDFGVGFVDFLEADDVGVILFFWILVRL